MNLFYINNNTLTPSPHALMIEPFSTIWEYDDTEKKSHAIQVFRYIDLMCSPRTSNPFYGIPEKQRSGQVKVEVYGDENYKDTQFMVEGIIKYKECLSIASPTYPLLEAALRASDSLVAFFNKIDFEKVTSSGAMKIKPKEITSALKDVPEAAKAIQIMRSKVETELIEADTKTRNQREIGDYEE